MNEEQITETPSWKNPRGQVMKTPDDVAEMLRLRACGWGLKRIARQLGCSHHTVKDYVATGGVKPCSAPSPAYLDDFVSSEDGLRLAKAFMQIPRSALRLRIVALVRELAGEDGG